MLRRRKEHGTHTPRWSSAKFVIIVFAFFGGVRTMSIFHLDRSFRSYVAKTPNASYEPIPAPTKTSDSVSATSPTSERGATISKPKPPKQRGSGGTSDNGQESDGTKVSTETGIIQHQVPIQTGCVRFATMDHIGGNGLGHRFAVVVLGMQFAQETNSTYVYDDKVWRRKSKHGSYPWMTDFLPLRSTELNEDDGRYHKYRDELQTIEGQWADVVKRSKSTVCNVSFRIDYRNCCEDTDEIGTCYCTKDTARIGAFEAMKGRLRGAFSKSDYTPKEQLSDLLGDPDSARSVVAIAWHLRLGDIVLNADRDYFRAIATQMAAAFRNSRTIPRVFFFGQGTESVISRDFPFLREMCREFFYDRCSYPETDVRDTLYHMIHSDVLVTSGSSFTAMAGMLRTRGVTLAAVPKEGVVGIYETSEHLRIDLNGTIPNVTVLQKFLQERATTNRRPPFD